MEPISERKRVLSDIEQSIQNALALFNSKDLGEGIDKYVIDDPIVSMHDTKKQELEKTNEIQNSCQAEVVKNNLSPKVKDNADDNQHYYDALTTLPFTNTKMSQESIALPFLDDPIKNTIEEMQKVLNTKCDILQTISQPINNQQSPEEILNQYSKDLGISLSLNASPRGDTERNMIESNSYKPKQNKKEKKNHKKPKQTKFNKEKKLEFKKMDPKPDLDMGQDIKLKELIDIYGFKENKITKPKSDSTIGSKSGLSRNASLKKINHTNINSSKASSVALSRKSKKQRYKFTNDLNINLGDGDTGPIEKTSRFSTKRKIKPRNNNSKPLKKQSLKRKIGSVLSNENIESNNSQQLSLRENNNKHRANSSKPTDIDNSYNRKKYIKQKAFSQTQKGNFNYTKQSFNNEVEKKSKNSNKNTLNSIQYTKEQQGIKSKTFFPDIQSDKLNSFLNKQQQESEVEKLDNLSGKQSEEKKLNKPVSLRDGVHTLHTHRSENKETNNVHITPCIGNDFNMAHTSQLHYTLPTQSSRSKEVERVLSANYQHLPFVIGQSTNKSHNLWVNIQEALSLIKHNIPQTVQIQTVNDTDSERPLSVLSKLTSKSSKKVHHCPALINEGLYDIPETAVEGEDAIKSWEDHPDCIQANLDPNFCRPRCSCLPQATLSYKKVLREIFGGGDNSVDWNGAREDVILDHGCDSYTAELRKVLLTFTQEFEDMNNKYEELLSDPTANKDEIERLEIYLETKEEEIREILARINEVKEMSEKSRIEGNQNRGGGPYSLEPFKSTTSVRLAQTLRRVQMFKESLRSQPSVSHHFLSKSNCPKSLY